MIASGGTATLGLYDLKRKIDAFGGVDYFRQNLAGGYLKNARVMLANGDIVKSTIDGNTNDPNVDVTGWVRTTQKTETVKNIFSFMTLVELAQQQNQGVNFDWTAIIQRAIDSISKNWQWLGGRNANINTFGTGTIFFPAILGGYKTTDTIYMGSYVSLAGESDFAFFSGKDRKVSAICPQFSNPLKWAIEFPMFHTSDGRRTAYDELIYGRFIGSNDYAWTYGGRIENMGVIAEFGECYGALKVHMASQVTVNNFYCFGTDYGLVACGSIVSNFTNLRLRTSKISCLVLGDSNNAYIDGYFSRSSTVTTAGTNLFAFSNMATRGLIQTWCDNSSGAGVVLIDNYGVTAGNIVSEGHTVGLVTMNSHLGVRSLYLEKNTWGSGFHFSDVTIQQLQGALNTNGKLLLGSRANVTLKNYEWVDDPSEAFPITGIHTFLSVLYVDSYFQHYMKGVVFVGEANVIYVNQTTGKSNSSGTRQDFPVASLDDAFARIRDSNMYDRTTILQQTKDWTIILPNDGLTYNVASQNNIKGRVLINTLSRSLTNKPKVNFTVQQTLNNGTLDFDYVDVISTSVNGIQTTTGKNSINFNVSNIEINGVGLISFGYNSVSVLDVLFSGSSITGAGKKIINASETDLSEGQHIVNMSRVGGSIEGTIINTCKPRSVGRWNGFTSVPTTKVLNYNPTAIAPSETLSVPDITIQGARLGDSVNVSFSSPLQGCQIWGEVTSPNTVKCYIRNNTAATVDLPSGDIKVILTF